MSQHIGAPCKPLVQKGDYVQVGQLIGDTDAFVSAPIHSSVSGTVKGLEEQRSAMGGTDTLVVIETDKKQEVYEGIRRDSSNFVYHVDYVMDGMVKRAGNNYLLSVGKLIGSSLKLEGKDRERIDDVWRKMAFVDEWNIEIPLPKGYKVSAEALKKIETSVANECGEFTVKATAGNESVKVYVRKCFAHRVEPVSNWSKLLALVDACSAFADKQMVIAK